MQNSNSLFRRDPNTILKIFIAVILILLIEMCHNREDWGSGSVVVMMFAVGFEDLSLIMGSTL